MASRFTVLWKEYKSLLIFVVLIVCFRSAVADYSAVPTGSMQPTIIEGDVILINKMAYDLRVPLTHTSLLRIAEPQRGDIIIFDSKVSDLRLVKRVIGIPGDTLEIIDKQLIVNGKKLPYLSNDGSYENGILDVTEDLLGIEHSVRLMPLRSQYSNFPATVVPDDTVFVMGDSRDNSVDSRAIGFVPRNEIIGRTRRTLASFDLENAFAPRSQRFLHQL
ncbi:MAG: signal peptidase I [Acidiferrobacterales bacterium]|nr:signal peptidase I [Acidiferrobacterales bacterium]